MGPPDRQQVHHTSTTHPDHVTFTHDFFGNVVGHWKQRKVVNNTVEFTQRAVHEGEIPRVVTGCGHDQCNARPLHVGQFECPLDQASGSSATGINAWEETAAGSKNLSGHSDTHLLFGVVVIIVVSMSTAAGT